MTTGHSQGCTSSPMPNSTAASHLAGEEFFNQRELTETHRRSCASSTVRNSLAILSSTPLTYLWDSVAPNFWPGDRLADDDLVRHIDSVSQLKVPSEAGSAQSGRARLSAIKGGENNSSMASTSAVTPLNTALKYSPSVCESHYRPGTQPQYRSHSHPKASTDKAPVSQNVWLYGAVRQGVMLSHQSRNALNNSPSRPHSSRLRRLCFLRYPPSALQPAQGCQPSARRRQRVYRFSAPPIPLVHSPPRIQSEECHRESPHPAR